MWICFEGYSHKQSSVTTYATMGICIYVKMCGIYPLFVIPVKQSLKRKVDENVVCIVGRNRNHEEFVPKLVKKNVATHFRMTPLEVKWKPHSLINHNF